MVPSSLVSWDPWEEAVPMVNLPSKRQQPTQHICALSSACPTSLCTAIGRLP